MEDVKFASVRGNGGSGASATVKPEGRMTEKLREISRLMEEQAIILDLLEERLMPVILLSYEENKVRSDEMEKAVEKMESSEPPIMQLAEVAGKKLMQNNKRIATIVKGVERYI